jgi:hypothetical protein
MKIFLLKILLGICLIYLFAQLIEKFNHPYTNNVWYGTKMNYLKSIQEKEKFNLFFLGSSTVYRQIDPIIIDRLNTQYRTKSFNLGAPATFSPQTYYLLEEILKDDELSKDLNYIVLDLMDINPILKDLKHQARSTYWVNWKELNFIRRVLASKKELNTIGKAVIIKDYIIAYIENTFNFMQYSEQILDRNYFDPRFLGKFKNGYYPIEDDIKEASSEKKNGLLQRKNDLQSNPQFLSNLANQSKNLKKVEVNQIHLDRLKDLIEKASVSGIKLIFLQSPRVVDSDVQALFDALPLSNKISLFGADTYPEFYAIENSFDKGHLNSKGADIYSEKLAFALNSMF